MKVSSFSQVVFILLLVVSVSCKEKKNGPSSSLINEINLKRGAVISCGTGENQFGTLAFNMSCGNEVKADFDLAVKMLHSFEYDEAEKVFASIIDKEPACAMAYWGVAMSNFHPLWTPPTESELIKGEKAIAIAQSISEQSKRETGYINAVASFYKDFKTVDHRTRCINFEKAMEKLYTEYPADKEAAIFYSLALTAAADPTDKSYTKQKKAGEILKGLQSAEPNHPGIVHYIIHTYDSPELANLALVAARKYASVAPSSAHALHMPSHIFTRLGLWDECIKSNLASTSAAKCYAKAAGMKGHWDEELHGLDYLVYGYLQQGNNEEAKKQWDYLKTITEVEPLNFKVVYAFAAIPARYVLENKMWKEAAMLKVHYNNIAWQNFQWQSAIVHFTRALGAANNGATDSARAELKELNSIHEAIIRQKDNYKASQVEIQMKTAEAWIQFKEGKNDAALVLMNEAATMEDKTEKHPVSPGEVLPARELLGDMLLQMNKPGMALNAYEEDLKKHPNRFNGLYGAGLAAERSGNVEKAGLYYRQLGAITDKVKSNRPELALAKQYAERHQ